MSAPDPLHARLEPRLWLLADRRRAWLQRGAQPEASRHTAADPVSTRRLLDGAVAAAWNRAATQPRPRAAMTPIRWIWRLCGYVHLTTDTPRLLGAAADRFAAQGRDALARWAHERAREEDKHDVLALRDLAAMGVDGPKAIEALRPHPAQRLVAWFRDAALATDPIACVGYAYAVERLSIETGTEDIEAVQALLPEGLHATRCMRVHSGAGSDADHVDETVRVVSQLSPPVREAVVLATYQAAAVCAAPEPSGPRTNEWIAQRLTAARCFEGDRPWTPARLPRSTHEQPLEDNRRKQS